MSQDMAAQSLSLKSFPNQLSKMKEEGRKESGLQPRAQTTLTLFTFAYVNQSCDGHHNLEDIPNQLDYVYHCT